MFFNVQISIGYIEDSSNSSLWFSYSPTIERTDLQILQDLKDLFLDYASKSVKSNKRHVRRHCYKYIPPDCYFCPRCGVEVPKALSDLDIKCKAAVLVRDLFTEDCVDVDQDFVTFAGERGWELWGRPQSGRLIRIGSFDNVLEEGNSYYDIDAYDLVVSNKKGLNF